MLKRIVEFLKQSPIIFVWLIILILAFIVGKPNIGVPLDSKYLLASVIILGIFSILVSFRNYNILPILVLYSKSFMLNNDIIIWHFIKLAVRNNLFLIIFVSIMQGELIKKGHFTTVLQILAIQLISLLLSFIVMYCKNKHVNKKIFKTIENKQKINPYIKSTLYDYFTPDLILMSILSIVLSVGILISFLINTHLFSQMGNSPQPFVGIIIVVLAIGFSGIIDSIPNINWKFYAIIHPHYFYYHVQKTIKILMGCFCLLLIIFSIIHSLFGILHLIKYLYCVIVLMLFSIVNAFTLNHSILKIVRSLAFSVLTIYLSTLHLGFMLILPIPILFMAVLAKNDYKERYFL